MVILDVVKLVSEILYLCLAEKWSFVLFTALELLNPFKGSQILQIYKDPIALTSRRKVRLNIQTFFSK